MITRNVLKVTPQSALEVLQRLALHFPQSKQVSVLDLLADDYARACRDMTREEFEDAALKSLETAKYFPTVAHIREAWDEARAERRRLEAESRQREEGHSLGCEGEMCTDRAREVLEALKTGRRPGFMQ
jgi:hypothetical protein